MTVSRVLWVIVTPALLSVGALVCVFAMSAPYIGLGEQEQFVLYQRFGWARGQVFDVGARLLSFGFVSFIISYLMKSWPRISGRARAWIGRVDDLVSSKLPARASSAWMQSTDVVRNLDLRSRNAWIQSTDVVRNLGLRSSLIVVLFSMVIGVLGFEIYHRFELVGRIKDRTNNAVLWIHSNSLQVDERLDDYLQSYNKTPEGGQFRASTKFDLSIAHESKGIRNFTVLTNSHGLLSDHEYTVKRNPKNPEYRIAVLGDSFTGPTTSTYQWVDTIEELLNSSQVMRNAVGGKTFRVYNFGWVGAGFQTFWKEYDKAARRFDPDMVIVNYIELDFPRTDEGHISTNEEMVRHARGHMEKIFNEHDNVLVTLMPSYGDVVPNEPDAMSDYTRTKMLMAEYPRFRPILMKELMPTHLGKEEIISWFNYPHDLHYSDRGGEIYARKLSSLIAERITGERLDFSDVKTKYSDIVMGPGKPRLRPVKTSVAYLAESPERIRYLKNYLERETVRSRVFTFYPYSWNAITGRGSDGIETAMTEAHAGTFVDVPFGPGKDEYVKLNIMCIRKPGPAPRTNPRWRLDNPECKHYHSIFARGR